MLWCVTLPMDGAGGVSGTIKVVMIIVCKIQEKFVYIETCKRRFYRTHNKLTTLVVFHKLTRHVQKSDINVVDESESDTAIHSKRTFCLSRLSIQPFQATNGHTVMNYRSEFLY